MLPAELFTQTDEAEDPLVVSQITRLGTELPTIKDYIYDPLAPQSREEVNAILATNFPISDMASIRRRIMADIDLTMARVN